MRKLFLILCGLWLVMISTTGLAQEKILNIYTWASYMPATVLKEFTQETGITVRYSTFDNNQQLYTKLKADPNIDYDIVMPTNYIVTRMTDEGMLKKLDHSKLPNMQYLEPSLLNRDYDPGNQYSLPYLWGTTALLVNTKVYSVNQVDSWKKLWHGDFEGQVAMSDAARDVISAAFLYLGYSINDQNPEHIKEAYLALKQFMPNIQSFVSDGSQQMYVNEDANIGMLGSGDALSVIKENPSYQYIYPKEGAIIWIDNMAIARGAKHTENAYQFMNFVMRPDIAKEISLTVGYASPNRAAKALMPKDMQNNPILYPPKSILQHGQIESAVSTKTNALYLKYWELLKLGG